MIVDTIEMKSIGDIVRRWKMRRMLQRNLIPQPVWHGVTRQIKVLQGLDAVQMAHLRVLATWFLHNKSINGVQGLGVTLEMRVAVAAQACLLILNLDTDYFDDWVEVVLYPDAFRVKHERLDALGLLHNEASELTGEAWLHGPVILSWVDVERDSFHSQAGHNVVLHEFAHKLDGLNGVTNGLPPLRRGMAMKSWAEDLSVAYDALCMQVVAGESPSINSYAATSPAEFFAVVTEYFFTAPEILNNCYPDVYRQLVKFYRHNALH